MTSIKQRKAELEREIELRRKQGGRSICHRKFLNCPYILNAELKGITFAQAEILKKVEEVIDSIVNPYPKDIFKWDNKEKLNFNRGRFNQHCFEIVEHIREGIKKELKSQLGGEEK